MSIKTHIALCKIAAGYQSPMLSPVEWRRQSALADQESKQLEAFLEEEHRRAFDPDDASANLWYRLTHPVDTWGKSNLDVAFMRAGAGDIKRIQKTWEPIRDALGNTTGYREPAAEVEARDFAQQQRNLITPSTSDKELAQLAYRPASTPGEKGHYDPLLFRALKEQRWRAVEAEHESEDTQLPVSPSAPAKTAVAATRPVPKRPQNLPAGFTWSDQAPSTVAPSKPTGNQMYIDQTTGNIIQRTYANKPNSRGRYGYVESVYSPSAYGADSRQANGGTTSSNPSAPPTAPQNGKFEQDYTDPESGMAMTRHFNSKQSANGKWGYMDVARTSKPAVTRQIAKTNPRPPAK